MLNDNKGKSTLTKILIQRRPISEIKKNLNNLYNMSVVRLIGFLQHRVDKGRFFQESVTTPTE